MTGIEIFLIVVGVVAIVGSFVFSSQFESADKKNINVLDSVDEEVLQKKVDEVIDTILDEKLENTEVKIDKIMNEKIMTVGEYSENVISDIDKNHEEVMFLYGILNDKEKDVKKALIDVENLKRSIRNDKDTSKQDTKEDKSDVTVSSDEVKEEPKQENKSNSYKGKKGSRNQRANRQNSNNSSNNSKNGNNNNDNSQDTKSAVALSAKDVKAKSNNNEKILEMYKQGKEPIEIARKLKLGMGEVRLVIDLYKNR